MTADDARRDCRVCIIGTQLCVRHVHMKLPNEKYRNIQQALLATPDSYPIEHVVLKTHSVVQGISDLSWDNAHVGQLPNKVFMPMVDNDVYTGKVANNPLNVKHFSASQVAIYLYGEIPALQLSSILLKIDKKMDTEVYLQKNGRRDTDNGLDITWTDCCISGFHTYPSFCHGEPQEVKIKNFERKYRV